MQNISRHDAPINKARILARMHLQTYRSLGVQTHHQSQQPSVHLRCLIMLPIREFAVQLRHCIPSQGQLDIISQRRASDLSILRCADSSSESATKRSFRVSSWLGCKGCSNQGQVEYNICMSTALSCRQSLYQQISVQTLASTAARRSWITGAATIPSSSQYAATPV